MPLPARDAISQDERQTGSSHILDTDKEIIRHQFQTGFQQ